MGQYHSIKCPICAANIQADEIIETCPACKEFIGDKVRKQLGGTGINTAVSDGPNMHPLIGVEQIVY